MKTLTKGHTLFLLGLILVLGACSALPIGRTITPTAEVTLPATPPTSALPGTEAPPAATPVPSLVAQVELWLSWTSTELFDLEQVLQGFSTEYPGVSIHLVYMPADQIIPALMGLPSSATGPTLVLGPSSWVEQLWEGGLVRDISDWVSGELRDRIYPVAWTQIAYGGSVVGLPLEMQGVVLFRNRSLVPEPAAMLDELVRGAVALHQAGNGVGAPLDLGYTFSVSHLAACEGSFRDAQGDLGFRGQIGTCWLTLLKEWSEAGPITYNTDQDLQFFKAGDAAWLVDVVQRGVELEQALVTEGVSVDPWPLYDVTVDRLNGYVWTENVYLTSMATGDDLQAAQALATYLLSPQPQKMLSNPNGANHLPVLMAVELDSPIQGQALAVLSQGVPLPLISTLDRYGELMERAIRLVVDENVDPLVALNAIIPRIESLMRVLEATPTPGP